jgi:hypothetical protein
LGYREDERPNMEKSVAMSAHFKADRNPQEATIRALAQMLLLAANPIIEEP